MNVNTRASRALLLVSVTVASMGVATLASPAAVAGSTTPPVGGDCGCSGWLSFSVGSTASWSTLSVASHSSGAVQQSSQVAVNVNADGGDADARQSNSQVVVQSNTQSSNADGSAVQSSSQSISVSVATGGQPHGQVVVQSSDQRDAATDGAEASAANDRVARSGLFCIKSTHALRCGGCPLPFLGGCSGLHPAG